MSEKTDLQTAVEELQKNQTAYSKVNKYYDGDHDLSFATEKFENAFGNLFLEFSLNMCPAVVDALKDKMIVTGYRNEDGDDKDLSETLWKIWQQNRMGTRSGQIHKEAFRSGDAYAIVWVDPAKRTTIYPQSAESCTVFYDDETPGKITWAAKYWKRADQRFRLNLYYADRIERYISKPQSELRTLRPRSDEPKISYMLPNDFIEFDIPILNQYGTVPVFHFANNGDVGAFGRSELKDVVPVQDALNKSVLDMMVAMEFAAFRQRWASGIEMQYEDDGETPKTPFVAGLERLWITESGEAKFGSFDASDLEQFLKVKDSFRSDFASVSGTPIHYFMQSGANFPQSGESIRRAETRFVHKVKDRQESFGNVWEDIMSFALMIEGGQKKDIQIFTEWEDAGRLTAKEELENLILKQSIGVPEEQLLTEAEYGKAEIDDWMKAKEEKKAKDREDLAKSFNRGEI